MVTVINQPIGLKIVGTARIAVEEQNSLGNKKSSRMLKTKYFQMYSVFFKKKEKKVFTKIFPLFSL